MPRKICQGCQRPINTCLCADYVQLQAPCRVVILQHPTEQKQALATVPILTACLAGVEVWVGEDFAHHEPFQELIQQGQNTGNTVVIFPAENASEWGFPPSSASSRGIETVVVIDGTWRKAKKIWLSNPQLHLLPCVRLVGLPSSEYRIRQSDVEGTLSTLEAVRYACEVIDPDGDYERLMKPFRAMIEMQIKKMGDEIFNAHYGSDKA